MSEDGIQFNQRVTLCFGGTMHCSYFLFTLIPRLLQNNFNHQTDLRLMPLRTRVYYTMQGAE